MTFYDEMRDVATDLLGEFKQGTVNLKRIISIPGPNPWDPPTETPQTWPLSAAVSTVSTKYVDGTLILASDRQVIFAVPLVTPLMTDTLVIDGNEFAMKDLRALPGAGTPVAYVAFVAG